MRKVFCFFVVVLLLLPGCEQQTSKDVDSSAAIDTAAQTNVAVFQCPMHPSFNSHDADANCPICGMSLVRKTKAEPSADTEAIAVSSEMIQSMGVRTAPAQVLTLGRTLRAFGTVETDERRENVTVSRIEGWIDKLQPGAEGDAIRAGALLYRVYSPDLIAAQKDYLNSLTIGNEKRIAAVLQRLKSLGMQETAIDRLKASQKILERIPVYAEAGGIVAQLNVREGDYVKPGSPIMRLQSYKSVWVIARIPEQNLSQVSTGLAAQLNFPSAPGTPITGEINYIYPTIDATTRTGKVRIEVDNKQGFLRPGAYADITFDLPDQAKLSIPTEAILRDSRGQHVIIALGQGRFTSRPITVGISTGELTEVTTGLEEGDMIVASGQFLLDSEVNLREGLSKFGDTQSMQSPSDQSDPHAGHSH